MLSPDVVLVSDGGGERKAALRPISGREKVLGFLLGVSPVGPALDAEVVRANGAAALALSLDGSLDSLLQWSIEHGFVPAVYFVRNPAKLGSVASPVALSR